MWSVKTNKFEAKLRSRIISFSYICPLYPCCKFWAYLICVFHFSDVRFILMSLTAVNAASAEPPCYRKLSNSVLVEDTLSGAKLQLLGNAKVEACKINCFQGQKSVLQKLPNEFLTAWCTGNFWKVDDPLANKKNRCLWDPEVYYLNVKTLHGTVSWTSHIYIPFLRILVSSSKSPK